MNKILLVAAILLVVPTLVLAQGEEPDANSDDDTPRVTVSDSGEFERRPASRRYIALGTNAFLHGYVTGVFSDFGDGFPDPSDLPPGQLLVPRTDNTSFAYDWALFVGADLSEYTRVVAETHLVSDPGGDFQPVVAATEANVTWMPFGPDPLRISMGLYWAPFGLVSDDWFSTENLFALIPEAANAFPLHYNERGVKVEGQFSLGQRRGLNYALSVGNGVRGLSIADQKSFDFDDNKAVVGRVGFFPGPEGLEIGLSGMTGTLRDAEDLTRNLDDARRYAADFTAWGLDTVYITSRAKLRGYWIASQEELNGPGDLDREGWLIEASFTTWEGDGIFIAIEPKIRFDHSRVDLLALAGGGERENDVVAVGVDIWPRGGAVLRVEYFFNEEDDAHELDNDGVAIRLSAIF